MTKNIILLLSVFAACSFFGCGSKTEPTSSSGGTPAANQNVPLPDPPFVAKCEPGTPGGRLVIATFGDPKTLNPITANEGSSQDIYRFIFASLLGYDWPAQEVTPGLAQSWTVEPDNKTYTFKLRKNLKWSDGAPLTADDVIFTFNDIIYNPDIVNVTVDVLRVDGKNFQVTKVDDLTIKVVTPEIFAPFLESFGGIPILPKHKLAKAVAEKRFPSAYGINTAPGEIVGSGPFRLKEFKPAQFTLLERNPYFYEVDSKGQRLPYLDTVVYSVVPNMNAMSLSFLSGGSDVQETITPDEYDKFKAESANGKFKLYDLGFGPERIFFWFNMNTNKNQKTGKPYVDAKKLKWFRNTKFRQAVSYAVDRESIIKAIYSGRAKIGYGFISPANKKWYNPNTAAYAYDPARARALLKEIGIEDRDGDGVLEDAEGNKIEFVFNTNTGNGVREKTATLIQADLKRLGMAVTYQPLEFNTLVDKIDVSYDYDCILMGLGGGGMDPADNLNVLRSDGFTHFWFPREKTPATEWEARIDQLMNAQLKTIDFKERKKYFDEVQEIMGREMPFIYTVQPYTYAAIRADVGNVRPTAISYYRVTWNAEELYIKKK